MFHYIGVPLGWGAKDPRTSHGPLELLEEGYALSPTIDLLPSLMSEEFNPPYEQAYEPVYQTCQALSRCVENTLEKGMKPLVVGGDHSMAIGTWSGVKSYVNDKKIGLLWLDAHLDAHTYETSHSKSLHGMPVSCLLGYGDEKLQSLCPFTPVIEPDHLIYIGARSFEKEELEALCKRNVTIYFMKEVHLRGIEAVLKEALETLSSKVDYLGISLDIDFFDAKDVPGTGTPEKEGLHFNEFEPYLSTLLNHPKTIAFEIAEYNPKKDQDGITKKLMKSLLKSAQNRVKE